MKKTKIYTFVCVIFVFTSLTCLSFLCNKQTYAAQNSFQNEKIILSYQNKTYQSCLNNGQTNETQKSFQNEKIILSYQNKTFCYDLSKNIKKSDVFSLDYQINKYGRFDGKNTRKELLKVMLNAGFENQIAVSYIFPNFNKLVDKMGKNIYLKPIDAKLSLNPNSEKVFYITKERPGLKLDKAKLYSDIVSAYLANKPLEFDLPTQKLLPNIYASEFKRFANLRGDFSTNIASSSADRKHNIKNALSSLNGLEIQPGEIFSFNAAIGRRTEANGYRPAKIIVNNEFVDGLGGGVCQVSSTLYNTALLSGLKIVEANKHSKQVGYVKYGFDAMVNFGSSDLKFENTTSQKLTIITNFSQSKIRIRIFGQDLANVKYKLVNEIVSTTEPNLVEKSDTKGEYSDKVVYDDQSFVLKAGSRGMEVKSYRQKYVDNQLEETQLLRFDKFKAQDKVVIFGAKKRPQEFFLVTA